MSAAMRRFSRRQMLSRPARALLTLFSIILGVAAISAVEMLSVSIRGASQNLFNTVAGQADLVVQAAADAPLNESLIQKIESVPGVKAAVPVIYGNVTILTHPGPNNVKTRGMVMGIDPQRDKQLRDQQLATGRLLGDPKPEPTAKPKTDAESADEESESDEAEDLPEVVLEENFAVARDVKVGDFIKIIPSLRKFRVIGLIRATSYARATAGGMAYLDLATAQELFMGGKKRVSAIQILSPKGQVDEIAKRINAQLPPGITAAPPAGRTAVLSQTMQPTETGLSVAVVFVTLLAAFMVFNTFMMNVSERRRQMAIIRAIGGTRRQLFNTLIAESLLLGVVGTAVGIFFGYWGTRFATFVLGHNLEVDFPMAELTPWVIGEACSFGIGIAELGALYPAWRASRLTPLEAMSALPPAEDERNQIGPITAGIFMVAGGGVLLFFTMNNYIPVNYGIYAALIILIGMVVLAETLLVNIVAELVSWMIRPLFGACAGLARRQIERNQTRSALTSGVLFIAAATGVGLSYVILDTVANVRDWYKRTIIGDFYVRVALPDFSSGESPETPEEFNQKLDNLDPRLLLHRKEDLHEKIDAATAKGDNDEVARLNKQDMELDQQLADTPVVSIDRGRMVKTKINGTDTMVGAREYPTQDHAGFDIVEGESVSDIYKAMMADKARREARRRAGKEEDPADDANIPPVVVSTVVARKGNIKAGQIVELDTPKGPRRVHVMGINNEYLVGGLLVWMQRTAAEDLLGISGYDGYIVMAKPGVENRQLLHSELKQMTSEYGLLLQSFAEIHSTIEGIIRSTDFMLWGLVVVEFVVAAFGVVNTLAMSVLEQTRELGMLRIIAMTREQVRRTIEAQALVIGLMGIVPGVGVGLLIAFLMNKATYASISHPVEFGFHPGIVLGILFGSLALVIIAAMVPAFRASRIDVLKALQYE
jgi:putative ABC transport system permease protein